MAEGVEVVLFRIGVDVCHPADPEHVLAQRMEEIPDDFGHALHQAPQDVVAPVVIAPLDVGDGAEVRGFVDDRGPGALLGCLAGLGVGRDVGLGVGVGCLGETDCHTADAEHGPAPDLQPAIADLLVRLGELLGLCAGTACVGVLAQLLKKRFGTPHQEVLLCGDPTGDRPEVARLDVDGAATTQWLGG
ncbi:hypothetical protein ACH4RG_34715 [Streptomyces sp. NPDC021019]|uniref:hypothetical protein n=1 Tax=Streptomyces sp. NPDC021019 TaxID=3365108 RepID=UPI0037A783C6